MEDILLLIVVVIAIVCGYFIMKKTDHFIEYNRSSMKTENEIKEPSCVMLTKELTDEEIVKEIHRFREKHKDVQIYLYSGSHLDMS